MEQAKQSLNDPKVVERLLREEREQVDLDQKERLSRAQKRTRKADWRDTEKTHG